MVNAKKNKKKIKWTDDKWTFNFDFVFQVWRKQKKKTLPEVRKYENYLAQFLVNSM